MKPSVALAIILALIAVLAFALWLCARSHTITFPLVPKAAAALSLSNGPAPSKVEGSFTSPASDSARVIGVKKTARARLGVGARGQPFAL